MGRPKGLEQEQEDGGQVVDYRESGLGKDFLAKLRRDRELYRPSKEQEESKTLKKEMAAMLAMAGCKTVTALGWNVTFTPGVNVTLDPKKLLELGVSVNIIKKATRRTTYETVTITPVKGE